MAILPFLLDCILLNQLNQLNQLHLTPKLSWQNSSKSLKNTCQFPFQTSLQAAAALAQKQRLQAATTGGNPFSTGGCSDPGGLVDFWIPVFFWGGFQRENVDLYQQEHVDLARNMGISPKKPGE